MPKGGARNRSGPRPDPLSGNSERRGYTLQALPASGFDGDPPGNPIPDAGERESALWEWIWTTPQACAWIHEPWRWHTIALWCRQAALCEIPGIAAADKTVLQRIADQIGMTPAGLKENGWRIAPSGSTPAVSSSADTPDDDADDPRSRLSIVRDAV